MIEVMYPGDIEKITSPDIQAYLHKCFKEIANPLVPEREGYFIYVDEFPLLYRSHHLMYFTLPVIADGLFNHVEGISMEGDIVEVSLLFSNEFLITLVFKGLDKKNLEIITKDRIDEKRD